MASCIKVKHPQKAERPQIAGPGSERGFSKKGFQIPRLQKPLATSRLHRILGYRPATFKCIQATDVLEAAPGQAVDISYALAIQEEQHLRRDLALKDSNMARYNFGVRVRLLQFVRRMAEYRTPARIERITWTETCGSLRVFAGQGSLTHHQTAHLHLINLNRTRHTRRYSFCAEKGSVGRVSPPMSAHASIPIPVLWPVIVGFFGNFHTGSKPTVSPSAMPSRYDHRKHRQICHQAVGRNEVDRNEQQLQTYPTREPPATPRAFNDQQGGPEAHAREVDLRRAGRGRPSDWITWLVRLAPAIQSFN